MRNTLIILAFVLGPYLLGGLSPSVFMSRRFGGFDVRSVGSGNAGSTNVLRTMGWRFGVLNLLLDGLKGVIAVGAAALILWNDPLRNWCMALAGISAVIGHVFPVQMKFKGGKGVATSLGAMLVMAPYAGLAACVAAILVIAVSRYVSLGSILGTLCALVVLIFMPVETLPAQVLGAALFAGIVYTHRSNLARLFRGKENRLDFKKIAK
jgi:glycerol-3-phosphate acyltransferase PlsY